MKFDDARREYLHHYEAQNALRKAFERDWVVRPAAGPSAVVPSWYDRGLLLSIRLSSWGGERVDLSVTPSGADNSTYHEPLRYLPVADLELVVRVRKYLERWMSGEIDELPVDFPRELLSSGG